MGGRRGVGSVVLLLVLAGCLDSPPVAGGGDGGGGGGGDGGTEPEADAGRCQPIVENGFDGAAWSALAPPGSFVTAAASWVEVRATPSADIYVYGDLHTGSRFAIESSTLTVEVEGPIVSVIGEVGIAWQNDDRGDFYQLEVADGQLQAIRATAEGGETLVCASTCPEYSSVGHQRLRLREQDGIVHYQAASEAGAWVDIGSAQATSLDYAIHFYASATGPGSGEVKVIAAQWLACRE